MSKERRAARALSREVDRLLSGAPRAEDEIPTHLEGEVAAARRLSAWGERLPPAPAALQRRVAAMVCAPMARGADRLRAWRTWRSVAWGALAAAAVLLAMWVLLPGGQQVLAQAVRVLLGQTEVQLTPTLDAPTRAIREPLRDAVAVELAMGRAPSLPRALPEGYDLQEMVAVSYPDLPSWISQPFYVELAYGVPGAPPGLWLREYRLLFREYGSIQGISASSASVSALEEEDVSGVPGALLTFTGSRATHAVIWERDGLLLELETDCLDPEELLDVARSVR